MCLDRTDAVFFGFFALVIALQTIWGADLLSSLVLPSVN